MDQLQKSCQDSINYPLNLITTQDALYDLRNKRDLLCAISGRTFADETNAALDLWEHRQKTFRPTTINSRQALRDHLNLANQSSDEASLCRFAFVQSSSSRTRLLLTKDMLTDLLTYFQVMASIIPMLASFGYDAGKDFQHCQFEADFRLQPADSGLVVPELKRSGRVIEVAYTFRTVEPSDSVQGMPWQIKQTCVYHNFDVKTGLSTWIIIKGSDLMKQRIMDAAKLAPTVQQDATVASTEAFLSSLSTQLMFADLSVENWRWYINFLEQEVQKITRTITFRPIVVRNTALSASSADSEDQITPLGFRARARSLTYSHLSRSSTLKSWMDRMEISDPALNCRTSIPPMTSVPAAQSLAPSVDETRAEEEAYFKSLQSIKGLEERAYDALLVLKTTIRIWKRLQRTYDELVTDEHFPNHLREDSQRGLKRFRSRLEGIQDALENQVLRVETLVTLLSGRKTLLHSILEWRSMSSGNDLAVQATKSSLKMEDMTARMQEIADRTERETVSMRIITLVTMFFLPGTFISTLMSTDIVRFKDNQKIYSSSALRLFLIVSMPMMLGTFFAWYIVYLCANNREKMQRAKKRLRSKTQV